MVRARKRATLNSYKARQNLFVLAFLVGCTQQTVTPTSEIAGDPISNVFTMHSFCPEINNDASPLAGLTGTIVLAGDEISFENEKFSPDSGQTSLLLFWNASSGKRTIHQLPEPQQIYHYLISPDETKLALTEGKTLPITSEVLVLTAQAQQEARFTLPADWTLFDWLNDQKLLSRQIRLRGENLGLVAIDPITGEQEFLPSDFPNLYSFETLVFWRALTIFDPTASFVIYPERKGNEIVSNLWDARNNKKIASITGLSKWPRWSPDGSQFLIVVDDRSMPTDSGHEEILLAKPNGEVTRSTFFKAHFEHNLIDLAIWSPNGRYIAFWQRTNLSTARLAVLDTETSVVDLYCKEVDPFPYRMGEHNTLGYSYYQINAAPLIWSPDSKNLLIEEYQNFMSNTYLLDLENHAITQIAESARPVGWLK